MLWKITLVVNTPKKFVLMFFQSLFTTFLTIYSFATLLHPLIFLIYQKMKPLYWRQILIPQTLWLLFTILWMKRKMTPIQLLTFPTMKVQMKRLFSLDSNIKSLDALKLNHFSWIYWVHQKYFLHQISSCVMMSPMMDLSLSISKIEPSTS